jgi:hypothetical protein
MHNPPKRLHNPTSPIAISNTTVPRNDSWLYIKFLYEELDEPRSRIESGLKDRYKHCYEQSKRLGLSIEQLIGCGEHKQVLALGNTVPPRVIKFFDKTKEWQREKSMYDDQQECKAQAT